MMGTESLVRQSETESSVMMSGAAVVGLVG